MSILSNWQDFISNNKSFIKIQIFRILLAFMFWYSCTIVGIFMSVIGFSNCIFHNIRIKKLEKKIKFLENYQIKNLNETRNDSS
jgi:hypothetical protein